jgi:hypothetical protein
MMNDESLSHSSFRVQHSSLISSVRQHSLDAFLITFRDHDIDIEISLSLIRLLGQDVTRVRMAALNLAGRGRAKSLRRAFVGF